jgi:hypothetical protein
MSGAMRRFIPASWNSNSKSETARRPRMMTLMCELAGEAHQEAGEGDHLDVGSWILRPPPHQVDPLLGVKVGALAVSCRHRHHHPVEQPRGPQDEVAVAVGDGVEGSGIDHAAHWGNPMVGRAIPRRRQSPDRSAPLAPASDDGRAGRRPGPGGRPRRAGRGMPGRRAPKCPAVRGRRANSARPPRSSERRWRPGRRYLRVVAVPPVPSARSGPPRRPPERPLPGPGPQSPRRGPGSGTPRSRGPAS